MANEINILNQVGEAPEHSIYLIEKFVYKDATVIITDLVLGCDLYQLRQNYKTDDISEKEARNIIIKLAKGVSKLTQLQVVHRDLH